MKCTVCFNAGYPKEIYTGHWLRETRDKDSRVVCPVIRNMVCKRCSKKGHNASRCKVNLEPVVPKQLPTKPKLISKNTFDFGDETESDDENKDESKDESKDENKDENKDERKDEIKKQIHVIKGKPKSWAECDSDSD